MTLSGRAFGAECPGRVTPPPSVGALRAAEAAVDGADLVVVTGADVHQRVAQLQRHAAAVGGKR